MSEPSICICGADAQVVERPYFLDGRGYVMYHVAALECECGVNRVQAHSSSRERAVEDWNRQQHQRREMRRG